MPDDERRRSGTKAAERPVGGGGERDQAGAVTERGIHGHEAGRRGDEVRGGTAEQAADGAEAARAGTKTVWPTRTAASAPASTTVPTDS